MDNKLKSVKHISDIPCARGALMSGIASGAGIGVMRGLSAGVLLAGHWAIATFAVVSLGSWYVLCMLRLSLFVTKKGVSQGIFVKHDLQMSVRR
jgi:cytochrome c oxidase assembly protein subunit 20